MLHYYKAYGLTIESEIPVKEFISIEHDESCQVTIVRGDIALPKQIHRFKQRRVLSHQGGILLYWKHIGAFLVEEGSRVTVMEKKSARNTGYVSAIIIGAVMGTLLLQREEHTLFHSAVLGKQDGLGAVSFMALSGGGKSTMGTAMIKQGFSLVCDDLLVLEKNSDPLTVQPGFPGMKLWKESAGTLVENPDQLPMIGEKGKFEKRSLPLEENFMEEPLPLGCIFLLNYGKVSSPIAERLSEKDALALLMPHWYGSLFGGDLLPILGKERLFKECSELARSARIYRLTRPPGLDRLDESAELVRAIRLNQTKEA